MQEITSEQLLSNIVALCGTRFVLENTNTDESVLMEVSPMELTDKAILRIKRNMPSPGGVRTILIVVLDVFDKVKTALKWAAAVKDELLEPENGDLYLFIIVKDKGLSVGECSNIESSDRICRKYILRPNETVESFLDRTFAAPIIGDESTIALFDPLHLALEKTGIKHAWFDSNEQDIWQKAFLSGRSGQEIIETLFKIEPLPNGTVK